MEENLEEFLSNPMDYSQFFTTSQIFSSRGELIEWAKATAASQNMFLIIGRSKRSDNCGNGRVWLICERGGKYRRSRNKIDVESSQFTGTKKCLCSFQLKGIEKTGGCWILEVKNGFHNHILGVYRHGYAQAAKLSKDEIKIAEKLSKSQVMPKQIHNFFRDKNPTSVSSLKNIYNIRYKFKVEEKEGRSVLQQLMKCLHDNGYQQWHRREGETNVVSDILYAHPQSINLLRLFPYVLVMDCTYKTNIYNMPLLEIVGISPTGHNFSVAFAYLRNEKVESYTWALDIVRQLFGKSILPQVIVTDRELALMDAIAQVFPKVSHFLCRRHISKNVEAHATKLFRDKSHGSKFSQGRWKRVVDSWNEDEYEMHVLEMEEKYKKWPTLLAYVRNEWLEPYKERFVSAWTNQLFHLGTLTTNRVESAHSILKHMLGLSVLSFDTA